MPELPEVETTRRGLEPHLVGRAIQRVVIRHHGMRWPVRRDLPRLLTGRRIVRLERRSKYLLVELDAGWLILHLGMSGSLRVLPQRSPAGKHDHLDIVLDDGAALRMTDPRRFGSVLWQGGDPQTHPRLRNLGPEPLSAQFTPEWMHSRTRGRKAAIKTLLMDSQLVCGVGNIYANEALFRAGIHPARAAGRIALSRYAALVESVRDTLRAAIRAGGSSVRDFVHADGSAGWFQQEYAVYGRQGLPCPRCGAAVKSMRIGQRSAFYCAKCQR
jgi:formamidopyrimidine-DNA glycosylase